MKSNLKIIVVIGSGFDGIAAVLRLKAKKYNVTLVEKHQDPGGRARVFKKNGFTFDAGSTAIAAPYLINELFELFNKNPKEYINLVPLKTCYRFIFDDAILKVIFIGLASLTFPHILFEYLLEKNEK